MADKRSLVTSRLLTQQDPEEQKIIDIKSELEVKDFLSIRSCKLRKKGSKKYFKVWLGSAIVDTKEISSLLDYAFCYDSKVSLLVRACSIVRAIRVVTFLEYSDKEMGRAIVVGAIYIVLIRSNVVDISFFRKTSMAAVTFGHNLSILIRSNQ